MRISVILAHPNKESFNHAIAAAAVQTLKQNGHEVYFHDLYQEKLTQFCCLKKSRRTHPCRMK